MSDQPLTQAMLVSTLAEFHRTVIRPDVERIVGHAIDGLRRDVDVRFDEVNGRFDDIYGRFDRLETEYVSITAALARVEERLGRVEKAP
jgi:hypothetical protein